MESGILQVMSWMCDQTGNNFTHDYEDQNFSDYSSNETLSQTSELNHSANNWELPEERVSYKFIMVWIIIPVICAFGLLGNSLALAVLVRRITENIEMLEKGSLVGMIGLLIIHFHSVLMDHSGCNRPLALGIKIRWSYEQFGSKDLRQVLLIQCPSAQYTQTGYETSPHAIAYSKEVGHLID